jgi:hypothetical protein
MRMVYMSMLPALSYAEPEKVACLSRCCVLACARSCAACKFTSGKQPYRYPLLWNLHRSSFNGWS